MHAVLTGEEASGRLFLRSTVNGSRERARKGLRLPSALSMLSGAGFGVQASCLASALSPLLFLLLIAVLLWDQLQPAEKGAAVSYNTVKVSTCWCWCS